MRAMPKREPVPRKPCECGCGEMAAPRKRYISGHNSRGRQMSAEGRQRLRESKLGERNPMFGKTPANARPKPAATPCACGCGIDSTPGRRYISGHNNQGKTGPAAARYSGGRYKRADGYIFVLSPDHPLAFRNYVPEHRLVMEEHLRTTDPQTPYLIQLGSQLYLRPEFIVHHMDEVKDNNVIENLRPMTLAEHKRWHNLHSRK